MKKFVALIVALVSALAISVAAFAADPSYDSSVNGSKAITQDTCVSWLISQDKNGKLTEDVLNTGYLWSVYEARHVITATLRSSDEGFGYQFWYDDDGTFTCDMYSGSTKTRIAGKTSPVPAPNTAEARKGLRRNYYRCRNGRWWGVQHFQVWIRFLDWK